MWLPAKGPALDSIRDASARINIWHGPVRSGKTVSSLLAWVLFVDQAPPGDLYMVGKTELTLARNILQPLEAFLGANFRFSVGQHKAWMRTTSGRWRAIELVGANDQRAETKIRGATAAGAYGDEITLWPESFFKMMLSRLSVKGARLFGTTNPDGPYHWLKAEYLDRPELNLRAFTWPIDANPFLDPEYVRALKLEYGEGSLWFKRFIEGLWVAAEGAVYDFFNETEHTIDTLPPRAPDQLDLSIDYGTSNATSVGAYLSWNGVNEGDLRAVRHSGWYYDGRATGRQKTDSEYATEIIDWTQTLPMPVRNVYLDPSAASFKAELRKRGLNVRAAKNDVIDGIRVQARMLRSGEYRIRRDPSNAQCVRDYGAYLWDTNAQARGEDKPLKQHDHTKDDERYYLFTMFGGRKANAGDMRRASGL